MRDNNERWIIDKKEMVVMTKEKMDFTTVWQGNAAGKGYMEAEHFNLDIALPPYYGGRGGEAEPKGMLIASATACYIMTLASFLSKSKKIGRASCRERVKTEGDASAS